MDFIAKFFFKLWPRRKMWVLGNGRLGGQKYPNKCIFETIIYF